MSIFFLGLSLKSSSDVKKSGINDCLSNGLKSSYLSEQAALYDEFWVFLSGDDKQLINFQIYSINIESPLNVSKQAILYYRQEFDGVMLSSYLFLNMSHKYRSRFHFFYRN